MPLQGSQTNCNCSSGDGVPQPHGRHPLNSGAPTLVNAGRISFGGGRLTPDCQGLPLRKVWMWHFPSNVCLSAASRHSLRLLNILV